MISFYPLLTDIWVFSLVRPQSTSHDLPYGTFMVLILLIYPFCVILTEVRHLLWMIPFELTGLRTLREDEVLDPSSFPPRTPRPLAPVAISVLFEEEAGHCDFPLYDFPFLALSAPRVRTLSFALSLLSLPGTPVEGLLSPPVQGPSSTLEIFST